MVTRETFLGNTKIIETRKVWHWVYFDFLTFLMKMTNNSWFYSESLFEKILVKYLSFAKKIAPQCKIEKEIIKKELATTNIFKDNDDTIRPKFLN